MGVEIGKLLRKLNMYPDHWHMGEDIPMYHDQVERDPRLAEEMEFHEIPLEPGLWREWLNRRSSPHKLDKVMFIDGVRRIHKRLQGSDGVVGCIAEVVVGHLLWSPEGVRACESPQVKRFLLLPPNRMREIIEREAYFPTLERFSFEITGIKSEGEDRVSVEVNNLLLKEESAYLERMASRRDCFIVKDGTIHPGDPTFIGKDYGPLGLVKRVLKEYLPSSFMDVVRGLRRGERTPFYVIYLREPEDILRVLCYLRLLSPERGESPLKGMVRLETLVSRRDFEDEEKRESLKREISLAFDFLASFASSMTVKGCDLPRSPENLPIVASLESWLSSFFLPSDYISALLEGRDSSEDR